MPCSAIILSPMSLSLTLSRYHPLLVIVIVAVICCTSAEFITFCSVIVQSAIFYDPLSLPDPSTDMDSTRLWVIELYTRVGTGQGHAPIARGDEVECDL